MGYIVCSAEGKEHIAASEEAHFLLLFMFNVSCPVSLYALHREGREGLRGALSIGK